MPKPNIKKERSKKINQIFSSRAYILLGLMITVWFSGVTLSQAQSPVQAPDTPPSASGEIWGENCLPCHGSAGEGDGPTAQSIPNPLPDFSNPETARQSVPVERFEVIKNGRIENMMPPWENQLSDEQMWDAVAYVWRLGVSPQDLVAGEAIYTEQCLACHGEQGAGDGPEATTDINDFTDLTVMVQQSQEQLRTNYLAVDEAHADISLSEAEQWQALDYIRSFSFIMPERNGVLRGQVFHATTNEPIEDAQVILRLFRGNEEIETVTTQSDSEGNYIFENLSTEHTLVYVVEGEYQDITYQGEELGIFTPDSTETVVNLKVYDTTTDDEAINVSQIHLLLSFEPDWINVIQAIIIENRGEQTYIGQEGQTFSFSLPEGASRIRFQNSQAEQRFIEIGTGYADTAPIKPGEDNSPIVVAYAIPFDDDAFTMEIPIPADTPTFDVLMKDQGAVLESEQLTLFDTRELEGGVFSIYAGENLNEGETISFQLTNLDQLIFNLPPATSNGPSATVSGVVDQSLLLWIVIGAGVLAIVFVAVIYPYTYPQLQRQSARQAASDLNSRRRRLLMTIARLDQSFEEGEIDQSVYQEARTKYKAELMEIMEG